MNRPTRQKLNSFVKLTYVMALANLEPDTPLNFQMVRHGGEGDPLSRVCLLSPKSISDVMGGESKMLKSLRLLAQDRKTRLTY